jgi:ZIP family zinc transporter
MGEAFLWGLLGASSLLVGAGLAFGLPIHRRALGLVMGFGAGVLISAVAYELVLEAAGSSEGAGWAVALGLAAGAVTFYVGDLLLARHGAHHRKRAEGMAAGASGLAITLGIVLDGIPESFVIGAQTGGAGGVSAAVVVAVFLSNVPEAIAATSGMRASGTSRARILTLWGGVALASGLASLAGYGLMQDAGGAWLAFVLAYAGGAIITMLADTMMPEAFEKAGREVGLVTTLGFALAFAISVLE